MIDELLDFLFPDTIHLDVSKLAASPVPAVKEELKRVIAKANWHRPSVLILDDLDILCSAELEVGYFSLNWSFLCAIQTNLHLVFLLSRDPARRLNKYPPRVRDLRLALLSTIFKQLSSARNCCHCNGQKHSRSASCSRGKTCFRRNAFGRRVG